MGTTCGQRHWVLRKISGASNSELETPHWQPFTQLRHKSQTVNKPSRLKLRYISPGILNRPPKPLLMPWLKTSGIIMRLKATGFMDSWAFRSFHKPFLETTAWVHENMLTHCRPNCPAIFVAPYPNQPPSDLHFISKVFLHLQSHKHYLQTAKWCKSNHIVSTAATEYPKHVYSPKTMTATLTKEVKQIPLNSEKSIFYNKTIYDKWCNK